MLIDSELCDACNLSPYHVHSTYCTHNYEYLCYQWKYCGTIYPPSQLRAGHKLPLLLSPLSEDILGPVNHVHSL